MFNARPAKTTCHEPCGTYLPEGRLGPVSESPTIRPEIRPEALPLPVSRSSRRPERDPLHNTTEFAGCVSDPIFHGLRLVDQCEQFIRASRRVKFTISERVHEREQIRNCIPYQLL